MRTSLICIQIPGLAHTNLCTLNHALLVRRKFFLSMVSGTCIHFPFSVLLFLPYILLSHCISLVLSFRNSEIMNMIFLSRHPSS